MDTKLKTALLLCIPIVLIPILVLVFQKYQTKSQTPKQIYKLPMTTIPTPSDIQQTPGTYENQEFGYKVTYPLDWDMQEAIASTQAPTGVKLAGSILQENELQKVSFLEKEYKTWQGMFQIIVLNNPKKQNLDQWTKEYTMPLETDPMKDLAKVVGETTLGGQPAKKFSIFSFDHQQLAIAAIHNGLVYYVTFTGDNPNDSNKEAHDKIYNQILSSFTFIN